MEMEAPDFNALIQSLLDGQVADMKAFLTPVLLLVCWTLILWLWMYATRIPAMQKANLDPDTARHPGTYGDDFPASVRSVADNYNHLHEQPTIFYALMIFAGLTGGSSALMMNLGFAYVGLRVLHSFVQILSPKVMLRFLMFSLGTFVLFAMAILEVIRVFL